MKRNETDILCSEYKLFQITLLKYKKKSNPSIGPDNFNRVPFSYISRRLLTGILPDEVSELIFTRQV